MEETSTEALRATHTPGAVRRRLSRQARPDHLRDAMYGAVDGAVTTFAIVAGVAGAQLGTGVVLVLGVANLLADGFSMAVGNFLGLRSEAQQHRQTARTEREHVRLVPEGEREEVRQLLAGMGFTDDLLEDAVTTVTADEDRWVRFMLTEEHGFPAALPDPWRAAATTFVAFVAVGAIPLLAFVAELVAPTVFSAPFAWAVGLTGIAMFLVGAAKARVVDQRWWWSGLETMALGGVAAAVAFGVGALLQRLA